MNEVTCPGPRLRTWHAHAYANGPCLIAAVSLVGPLWGSVRRSAGHLCNGLKADLNLFVCHQASNLNSQHLVQEGQHRQEHNVGFKGPDLKSQMSSRSSRKARSATDKDNALIAKSAKIGPIRMPVNGYCKSTKSVETKTINSATCASVWAAVPNKIEDTKRAAGNS